ncbi:hypothetical protein TRAPUB_534 [Trametes pubescens]|uniref:Uncharacterized protein n=1 Tax=Trametes pubescens TaxID=154538 RepID=A0A1M2VLZ7_TRAPU|nr:hypothetical protein TRAPUB_534 [Trametes pubescens]
MRYFLSAILAFALGYCVVNSTSIVAPEATGVTTLAASFPVSELSTESGVRSNTTLAGRALHGLAARQEFPIDLLLCPAANCANCSTFPTEGLPKFTCFNADFTYKSASISQPSGEGFPFAIQAATPNCNSRAQLPGVNECFNLNGGPFNSFILEP